MKTKLTILMLISFAIIINTTSAQDKPESKNEIRLGYGVLTAPEMANSLMSVWPAIGMNIFKDTITDYRCSFYGAPDFEYHRHLARWVAIGVSMSVNPISTIIKGKSGMEFSYNYYLLTLMPRVDFYYLKKGIFSMYSGVQVGASYIFWQDRNGGSHTNDSGFSAAFHINAFGIRVGKDIGAFMEWGYGFRGVVNFGVSGKF
ncbi:MAG: hypothetical protein M0P58_04545 [Bacteroidales bacterium]|nr:hypothetical protein [Bacteroidales bacterium]